MSAAVGAAIRELPGYDAGRLDERAAVAASLRRRGGSAMALAKKGLLNQGEAERLKRWLNAAAQDVEAGLD